MSYKPFKSKPAFVPDVGFKPSLKGVFSNSEPGPANITSTPTPSVTPSFTPTVSLTPSTTPTVSLTSRETPTPTPSVTVSPA